MVEVSDLLEYDLLIAREIGLLECSVFLTGYGRSDRLRTKPVPDQRKRAMAPGVIIHRYDKLLNRASLKDPQ